MKINDIIDAEWLKVSDLENMFDITRKQSGEYMFNLNETLYIDVDESQLNEFICDCRMHWPLASYRIYGTTRLAWLLMKLNKVQAEDMFRPLEPSEKIVYINQNMVQTITKNINGYDDN